MDLNKKTAFRLAGKFHFFNKLEQIDLYFISVSDLSVPQLLDKHDKVNADEFWDSVKKGIVVKGLCEGNCSSRQLYHYVLKLIQDAPIHTK